MNKVILAGVAAVTLLGSGAVYAQHRHHHHSHHQRFSADDKAAFVDARIAAMKAGLRLSLEQEKNWPAVEAAIRGYAKQRIARAEARASERDARRAERQQAKAGKDGDAAKQAARPTPDLVNRLRQRADVMAERAAGMKKIADAADPLYKSLDDGQKRRLAALVRMGGRLDGGGAMRAMGREFERRHQRHHEHRRGPENRTERL
jgi:hypothetical protein